MSVRPLPTEQLNHNGVVARPLASRGVRFDRWDLFLCLGIVMLVCGVGLLIGSLLSAIAGIGAALSVGGVLFVVGALWGARNSIEDAP